MTQEGNVVLYLDKELVEQSRALGFNLSRTFQNHLKQLISQLSNNQSTQNVFPSKNEALWWAGPDLPQTGLCEFRQLVGKVPKTVVEKFISKL
jgi:hypothetical protein